MTDVYRHKSPASSCISLMEIFSTVHGFCGTNEDANACFNYQNDTCFKKAFCGLVDLILKFVPGSYMLGLPICIASYGGIIHVPNGHKYHHAN